MADREVDVLIVGAGAAGHACADALARDKGFEGSVLLAGRELDPPYDRPPVSKELLRGAEPTFLREPKGVELLTRTSVMKLDTEAKVAKLSTKEEVGYNAAVLCTGALVRRLRMPGTDLDGIHYLRALGNAKAVREEEGSRAVLIGGSYIACEVAASLTMQDKACTMVMLEDAPLTTHFGPTVAAWAGEQLRARGVELVCGDGLAGFEGEGRVARAVTESGRAVEADFAVMGTGAMPDVMLARSAGLELGETGGVKCSSSLATSADGVWAAGDSCEYDSVLHGRRVRIEHWDVARAQGRAAAAAVAGRPADFAEVPYFWCDLGDWAKIEWVGLAEAWDREEVTGSVDDSAFAIRYFAGDRLVAALSVGLPEELMSARAAMAST